MYNKTVYRRNSYITVIVVIYLLYYCAVSVAVSTKRFSLLHVSGEQYNIMSVHVYYCLQI